MAFTFWKKQKEEEAKLALEREKKVDIYQRPEYHKPKVSLLNSISEISLPYARLTNIVRYPDSIGAVLMIDPQFIFPSGSQRMGASFSGFDPIKNKYGEGLLVIGDVASRISNICIDVKITEESLNWSRLNDYSGSNFYHNNIHMLTFDRQVFSNVFKGLVTKTKESHLTDSKYRISFDVRSNIALSEYSDIKYHISGLVDKVKSLIEDNFRKEIIESRLVESKDKFFQQLSEDVMLDTFQQIIDIIPECRLAIGNHSIKFHIPVNGNNTHKDLRVSFDFDNKLSNILYELSEASNRIKSYYNESKIKVSFSDSGIMIEISPDISTESDDVELKSSRAIQLLRQGSSIRVNNPYYNFR